MKTVVVGISGGIAAFKVLEVIKLLKKQGIHVIPIMTQAACALLDSKVVEKVSESTVYIDLFPATLNTKTILEKHRVEHIDLAGQADLMLIAPATANVIAKLAHGIADDYLTTTALASICPIIVCPSMNVFMWTNPATVLNVDVLTDRGYDMLGPDKGMLACGYEGEGRLIEVESIISEVLLHLHKTDSLRGKKVLVTAGGTREDIDSVRFIGNRSSGKMGVAIAEAAFRQGAEVFLVRSKTSIHSRFKIVEEEFESAEDLENILKKNIADYDICFHAAAVSDFKVKSKIEGKLDSENSVNIELVPVAKILHTIKKINPKITLIGFKAVWNMSDEDIIATAQEKLSVSGADVIVANDVGKLDRGFDSDKNAVIIVDKVGKVEHIPLTSKTVIGEKIVELITKSIKRGEE